MKEVVKRNYLEIKSIEDLIESPMPLKDCSINIINQDDFQINKFFYKNIGKKHRWTDRLVWPEKDWIKYSSNPKVNTYILKIKGELAGYFELIFYLNICEVEIAYMGLLEEYHNKKLGGYLLTAAIKKSFKDINVKRVWVHTCTFDHQNALKNYLARGMKIFKTETIFL